MNRWRTGLSLVTLVLVGCGDSTSPEVPLRLRLEGIWNLTGCTYTSESTPARQSDCSANPPTLYVRAHGQWEYRFSPQSENMTGGYFGEDEGGFNAQFLGAPAFPVAVSEDEKTMVWTRLPSMADIGAGEESVIQVMTWTRQEPVES
jgi:hypothetical protein